MRRLALLTSLSASLVALTLGTGAVAAPGLITKTGQLHAQAITVSQDSSPAVLEQATRSVLADHVEPSRAVTLGKARVVSLASGDRIVKLPQVHKGLVVVHRGATVTWAGGAARHVTARLETDLPDDVIPSLTSDSAAAISEARTGLPVNANDVALALWPTPEGVRLAWAMSAQPIIGLPYQPVTIIDAKSGEVLLVYNSILDLNQTKMFPSNPVKSPDLVDAILPVGEGLSTLDNALVTSKNCIDQKAVKSINFMGFALDVHTCDLLQTALPDMNGDFLIAPGANNEAEDAFAEISLFHHTNRAYDMFRGFDPTLDVNNGNPLTTVSNLRIPQGFDTFDLDKIKDPELPLVPFQNAFFAPSDPIFSSVFGIQGGALWFGQGPVNDYSYDGDVVYHELTHAVVNVTLKLVGNPHMDEFGTVYSPGGMNEGLSDYFSSALTGDGDVGEYASKDFFPGSTAIRSLTNPDACPSAIGGEVHQDATLFAGGLWDARIALSPDEQPKLDAAVFAAMNAAPTGDLAYEEFAELVLTEVKASLGDTAAEALTAAWTKRGVLPKCTRVLEYTGGTLTGPKELQELWFAPGTQTTGAKNAAGGWTPGVVQIHYELPADTTKLDLSIREVNIGGGGFGGGTAFVPKFLVRFGADPINFTYKPTATTPDVLVLDGVKASSKHTLSIEVPAGSSDVYIMVTSTGQSDGAYTDFDMTAISMPPVTTGTGGDTGTGGTGGDGGNGTGASDTVVTGGCGCSVPDSGSSETAAFAALAALGLIASRRRRRGRS